MTINKVGFILGIVFAVIMLALPVPDNSAGAGVTTLSDDALVSPEQVSDLVIQGDISCLIIDLRSEEAFLEDGLKSALSIPAATLDEATIRRLPTRRLILYADDTEEAARVWAVVQPVHGDVLVMDGGMAAWNSMILNPSAPPEDAPEQAWNTYKERLAVANYYTGKEDAAPVQRERVVRPVLRPRLSGKKNEGC